MMAMAYQTLRVEIKDKIAKVFLNRPEKKNAMNPQLHQDMTEALEKLRYDDDAAVVVITGSGNSLSSVPALNEFFEPVKTTTAEASASRCSISADTPRPPLGCSPKP